ncbi:DNA-binding response regulator, partial [Salmonella enterica]|nr:DNA-binding response regulator [Salmonella enterica]
FEYCKKDYFSIFLKSKHKFDCYLKNEKILLSTDTIVLLSIKDIDLQNILVSFLFKKVSLCISPFGFYSKHNYFFQNGLCYFNRKISLSDLNKMLASMWRNIKNTNVITSKEFFILTEISKSTSSRKVSNKINLTEKMVSYYKRTALKKMGVESNQYYLCVHPVFSIIIEVIRGGGQLQKNIDMLN